MFYDIYFIVGIELGISGNVYSYLCDDYSVKIGDNVLVDVRGKEQIAKVVDVKTVSASEAPYPIDKMKHVIKKVESSYKDSYGEIHSSQNKEKEHTFAKEPILSSGSNTLEQKIVSRSVPLSGGSYVATYNLSNKDESNEYNKVQELTEKIDYYGARSTNFCVAYVLLIIVSVIVFFVTMNGTSWTAFIVSTIVLLIPRWICAGISMRAWNLKLKCKCELSSVDYRYILRNIPKQGGRVVYEHEGTGTISFYNKNGVKHSISVYRGYNSHYRGY